MKFVSFWTIEKFKNAISRLMITQVMVIKLYYLYFFIVYTQLNKTSVLMAYNFLISFLNVAKKTI